MLLVCAICRGSTRLVKSITAALKLGEPNVSCIPITKLTMHHYAWQVWAEEVEKWLPHVRPAHVSTLQVWRLILGALCLVNHRMVLLVWSCLPRCRCCVTPHCCWRRKCDCTGSAFDNPATQRDILGVSAFQELHSACPSWHLQASDIAAQISLACNR